MDPTLTPVAPVLFDIVDNLISGHLVPFLGAGMNGGTSLPQGDGLASYLEKRFDIPIDPQWKRTLSEVAQRVDHKRGRPGMAEVLHSIFDRDFTTTPLHIFLAHIPRYLRKRAALDKNFPARRRHLLIFTTNYDDLMEKAFESAGEDYEVLRYLTDEHNRGRFEHIAGSWTSGPINEPRSYSRVSTEKCNVIVKMHGAVHRPCSSVSKAPGFDSPSKDDSYVISEDDYIYYLSHSDPEEFLPREVFLRIQDSGFLFLGYRLADWNTRLILHRLRDMRKWAYKSWAITQSVTDYELALWQRRNVEFVSSELQALVPELQLALAACMQAAEAGFP